MVWFFFTSPRARDQSKATTMLKRIAGACIDRRPRLQTSDGSDSSSSHKSSVADGGDRVVGGASTVQEQDADLDRLEAQQVRLLGVRA